MMGIVPSIGLKWDNRISNEKPVMKIVPISLKGLKGRARTLQAQSLGSYGAKLFNHMPWEIRSYSGDVKAFKILLDGFLSKIPDEPFTEYLHPSAKNLYGEWSNCVTDWIRIGYGEMIDDSAQSEA